MYMYTKVNTDPLLLFFYLDGCIFSLLSSLPILDINPYKVYYLQGFSPNHQFAFTFC